MARRLRWPLLALALACVCGCAALEKGLLYHPAKSGDDGPLPSPLRDVELRTADGTKLHARWCPHPDSRGAVIYCPGNTGNLERRARPVRELYDALGESVLIFDYPGYGKSEGQPDEAGCYAAAEAAYRWLTEEQKVPPGRVIIYGESLGGAVAVELASRKPYRTLVLVRTFTTLPDVAKAKLSSAASASVKSRYDSLSRIGKCRWPIFVAAAERDEVVPYEQGVRLYRACGRPSTFYRLSGLRHNDPLPAEFYTKLKEFMNDQAPIVD